MYDPAIAFMGLYAREMKTYVHREICPCSSIIYDS